jgi:hypothetical protein
MNLEMNKLSDWFWANKLSLNIDKSNYMLFSNIPAHKNNNSKIIIGKAVIKRKDCVKFLGITMDENLTWQNHIKICKSKIASSIYAINRIKKIIPNNYLRTLYFSMIYPYLSYGIQIWGSAYKVHKKSLIISQKKSIRTISIAKYNAHTDPLFRNLSILKLDDIYRVEVAKMVFQFKTNCLPTQLQTLFTLNSSIHDRKTRQQYDLHVRKCRTTLASQHISFVGPQIWNSLPVELKTYTSGTTQNFVSKFVKYLIDRYRN